MFHRIVGAAAWFVIAFILAPLVVITAGSFTTAPVVNFPPTGFTLDWYAQLLGRRDFLESFVDSVLIALWCTGAATLLGVAAAIGLHRHRFVGHAAFRAFVISPLVLPTVVTGVALLQFYNVAHLDMPFTELVIGHVLITIPYVVRTVGAGLIGMDPAIEEAAESLGARPARVLLKVTLPAIAPSILSSTVFVFITSFDQVTISVFLSSPDLMPLPVRIYTYIDFSIDPMIAAVSTVLIGFAFLVLAILQKVLGLDRAFGAGQI
ncbi:MAG: ABC transporter permease [Pseudomonadota bacterium]